MAGQHGAKGGAGSSPQASKGKPDDKATTGESQADEPKAKEPTEIYHVVGPGSLMRSVKEKGEDGKDKLRTITLPPGELLELTEAEAEELGESVALGEPPPPPPPIAKRKAGRYVVEGPGCVVTTTDNNRNVFNPPGTEISLSENEARELGAVVREA